MGQVKVGNLWFTATRYSGNISGFMCAITRHNSLWAWSALGTDPDTFGKSQMSTGHQDAECAALALEGWLMDPCRPYRTTGLRWMPE